MSSSGMTISRTETFFLPDETERHNTRIPAKLYNLSRHLLSRSETGSVFVPIRNMQVFGVIAEDEIVFVDSLSYRHQDGRGGRVILISWQYDHHQQRESLDEPFEIDVIYHAENVDEIQLRLISEFLAAMEQLDQLDRVEMLPAGGAEIVRLV